MAMLQIAMMGGVPYPALRDAVDAITSEIQRLLSGLAELETDLHLHIHLENNILFPRAIRLEASRR